jgi:tRNA(adenine34) deaminase
VYTVDERWMGLALGLAETAAVRGEVPVGAIVVRGDSVLGEGYNRTLTDNDPSAHAEIVALRAAGSAVRNHRLPGTTLYVTIEPCTMCAGALVHARVERLVFGAREPKAGAVVSHAGVLDNPALNHRVEVVGDVLAARCSALISDFFKERRR